MSTELPGTVMTETVMTEKVQIDIDAESIDHMSTITVNVTTANFDSAEVKVLSPAQLFISSISNSIKDKPKTAAEAAALYAYILQKDVYPLMLELKNLFVSELSSLEKNAASSFLKEITDIKQVTKMKSCLPFL
jgi:hypothetical protein